MLLVGLTAGLAADGANLDALGVGVGVAAAEGAQPGAVLVVRGERHAYFHPMDLVCLARAAALTRPAPPPAPKRRRVYDGASFDPAKDEVRLNRQQAAVLEVMRDGGWRTLEMIQRHLRVHHELHASEASISARLRDLRKPQHGGHTIDRERLKEADGLWRYRLVLR